MYIIKCKKILLTKTNYNKRNDLLTKDKESEWLSKMLRDKKDDDDSNCHDKKDDDKKYDKNDDSENKAIYYTSGDSHYKTLNQCHYDHDFQGNCEKLT